MTGYKHANGLAAGLYLAAQANPGCALRWEIARRGGHAAEAALATEMPEGAEVDALSYCLEARSRGGPLSYLPDEAFHAYALARGGVEIAPLCEALREIQALVVDLAKQLGLSVRASDADTLGAVA